MRRMLAVVGVVVWLAVQSAALAAEPAPAIASAASAATELLKYAPPGTWAVLSVDCAALRSALLGDAPLLATPGVRASVIGWAADKLDAFAVFVLPVQARLDEPRPAMCGVVQLAPGARKLLEVELSPGMTKTTVAGRDGYVGAEGATLAFADDQTFVWGDSAESTSAILKSYESPVGPSARLTELLKSGDGDAVRGAVAFPVDLRAIAGSHLPPVEIPPVWLGTTGGTLNVRVQKGLRANLCLLMANPADAVNAAGMATASIQSVKERLAAMPPRPARQSSRLVLERLSVQALGAEVRFDLSLSEDEVRQLVQGFVSSLGQARAEAKKATSRMNLHFIGLGIAMYQAAHDDAYPPDLAALLTEGYLGGKEALLDPSDVKPVPVGQDGPPCSYEYIGPIPRGAPPATVIAYTRKGIYPDGRSVLYEDLAVMWVSEADLHDPQGKARTSLRASYQALMDSCGADMSDEQKARLKVFFEVE